MAIRVNFALSEQKIHQNISKKQNQNSLLISQKTDKPFGSQKIKGLIFQ